MNTYLLAIIVLMVSMSIFVTAWGFLKYKRSQPRPPEFVPEAPAIPRSVSDRLAGREAHPEAMERIAHARQLHYHDAEEAEARHGR